jgi:hypothetical protein
MEKRNASAFLHLARPRVGSDVRGLIRELAALSGVARVAPAAWLPRVLLINYDPTVIAVRTLLARATRGWTAARLVGAQATGPRSCV